MKGEGVFRGGLNCLGARSKEQGGGSWVWHTCSTGCVLRVCYTCRADLGKEQGARSKEQGARGRGGFIFE